jgi:hypothetical protein
LAYFNTDAVQDLLISWSEDGDNWKSTLLANPNMVDAITSVYGGRELFVNNKLFWGQNVADEFYYIDFDHMTCGVFTEPFSVTSAFYGAPVYYNGKIIVPGSNTSTSNMWVLLGGSAYSFHSHSAVTTGFSTDCHWAHFTEGPFIYVLQWINNALRVMQLRINLSEGSGYFSPVIMENNDITSTVKPDAWTLANSSFRIIYDPFTAPGQRANIYIGFHQGEAEGQAIDWYQWMGPGTEMVGVGSSGETYLALPYNNQFGGGERFWEPGNIGVNIEKTGLGSGRGRCKIWYRVTESTTIPSGTMAQVGFLGKPVGFNSNPPASGFISLVNTSVGSISADGKLINNVPIGSGELRTVEWDGSSDGVPSRAPAFIIPYASGILT